MVVDAKQAPSPMHKARGARRCRSDRVSYEHHDAADVGLIGGVDGALGAALVERAQDPAPVGRGLVGIDPDVIALPHARAMASSAMRTMNVSLPDIAPRLSAAAPGTRAGLAQCGVG